MKIIPESFQCEYCDKIYEHRSEALGCECSHYAEFKEMKAEIDRLKNIEDSYNAGLSISNAIKQFNNDHHATKPIAGGFIG